MDPVTSAIDDLQQHDEAGAAKRLAVRDLIVRAHGAGVPVLATKGDRHAWLVFDGVLHYLPVRYLDDPTPLPASTT
jgi:hypothetical protein